jgi:SAM-dependent methyltransferase
MTDPSNPLTVEEREAAYWDEQASLLSAEELRLEPQYDGGNTGRMLELLGDLNGKRVLDVGCGTGQWAVMLARRGAEVWGIDISPLSIAVAQRRSEAQAVASMVRASVMSATELQFADGFFDLVCGQDIIHHLDPDAFGREIARVLKPGGVAIFSENCANNPLLMFARNYLCGRFGIPKWSSDDEYPLTVTTRRRFGSSFADCRVEFPEFLFLFLFDAKLFHYRNRIVSWMCRTIDRAIAAVPLLRRYSYRQLVVCRKGGQNC